MTIVISRRAGGIRKLSQLEIDIDKHWLGYGISNLGDVSINDFKHLRMGSAIDIVTNGSYANFDTNRLRIAGDWIEFAFNRFIAGSSQGFYLITEFGNYLLLGNGFDLFRIQDFNDEHWHIVSSLYEDDQVKVSGTRWAFVDGDFDYHIGVGVTKDKLGSGYLLGMVGNTEFGLFSPLPYIERQGINISVNPNNYRVEHVDIRLNSQTGGYLSIIDDTVDILGYDGGYPSIETKHMVFSTNLFSDDFVGMYFSQTPEQDRYWQSLYVGVAKTGGIIALYDFLNNMAIDLVENPEHGYTMLRMSCGSMAPSTIGMVTSYYGSEVQLSARGMDLYITLGLDGASIHGNSYLDMRDLYGIFIPQVFSATEPVLMDGELKLWKNTSDNTYWLLWNVDGQIRKVQLT